MVLTSVYYCQAVVYTTKKIGKIGENLVTLTLKLYAAVWRSGAVSWVEAYSLAQARLIHTQRQHEIPVRVYEDDQLRF